VRRALRHPPHSVALRVDAGRRHPAVGKREDPVIGAARESDAEPVPLTDADGGPTEQREGDVGTEICCDLRESVAALSRIPEPGPPYGVAGDEGSGGVGASPRHATGNRDALLDMEMDPRLGPHAATAGRDDSVGSCPGGQCTPGPPARVVL